MKLWEGREGGEEGGEEEREGRRHWHRHTEGGERERDRPRISQLYCALLCIAAAQFKPPAPQPAAAQPPPPAPSGPRYFSVYDYAAADEDEISFNEGNGNTVHYFLNRASCNEEAMIV